MGESSLHFAAERCLRIYPTYWAALLFLITSRIAASPFNAAHLADSFPHGPAGWLGSAFLLEPYLGQDSFMLVSWSLVYELGFYLCAAVALMGMRRRIGSGFSYFLVGAALCFSPWIFHMTSSPWRVLDMWPDFFAGVAAWWSARRLARVSGYGVLSLMLAACIVWPGYGGLSRLAAITTAWILAIAWKWDSRLAIVPVVRPMIWFGGISYSLYLIHVPLISPLENLLVRWVPSRSYGFVVVWALAISVAIMGANVLNRFVEAPVEQWRRRIPLRWHRRVPT